MLERQLIKVPGVISIVFDAHRSRVTLRSRPDLSVEAVGQAVRRTQTMKAFLVVAASTDSEESLKPIGDANNPDDGCFIFQYFLGSSSYHIILMYI